MAEFTKEFPTIKAETVKVEAEEVLKQIHSAMQESGGLTPEIIEKIVNYMRSRMDDAVFPLNPRLESGEITLENCEKAPIIGHPGMILLSFQGEVVAIQRDPQQIKQ